MGRWIWQPRRGPRMRGGGGCRKVLLTVPGFNESRRRDWTLWHYYSQETSAYQPPPGSLSSQVPMIDKPEARRFPPPWIAEETDACFIIRDHNGYALAYVYFEEEPGRRAAAHLLTRDEARRIAANIAKLPELLAGR